MQIVVIVPFSKMADEAALNRWIRRVGHFMRRNLPLFVMAESSDRFEIRHGWKVKLWGD